MKDNEYASMLLSMAKKDLKALSGMTDATIFEEEIFGFHAQQAVEKSLKAWIASLGVEFPKTHDISYLLSLLEGQGISIEYYNDLIEYTSFAVHYVMRLTISSPNL